MISKAKQLAMPLLSRHSALLFLGALLTTVPYARVFGGWLPGDVGDARWTVAVHESWFLTLRGQLAIGETLFFFPYADAKGMSDIFLPQSLIYSALRLLDANPISAWLLSTIAFVGLLVLSLFVIARKTFGSFYGFAAFFLISATAFNFHAEMGHVQTAGYSLAFAFVALALPPRAQQANWLGNARPLVLALTLSALIFASWYAFVFLLLILFVFGVLALTLNRAAKSWRDFKHHFSYPMWSWLVTLVALLPTAVLWLVFYLPHIATSSARPWGEYLIYAPRTIDFLNPSRTQSLWGEVLNNWGTFSPVASGERTMGVALVTLVAFVVIAGVFVAQGVQRRLHRHTDSKLKSAKVTTSATFSVEALVSLTVVATLTLFVVTPSGFALYWFLWEFLPGAQTIRAPMRVTILLVPAMLWVILRYLETRWIGLREDLAVVPVKRLLIIGLLPIFMFVEQQTAISASWRRADFITVVAAEAGQALTQANCKAFVLSDSRAVEKPWWQAEIDAVSLAVATGVPTVNGYSAFAPEEFPWSSETHTSTTAGAAAKRDWAIARTSDQICILNVNSNGGLRVSK